MNAPLSLVQSAQPARFSTAEFLGMIEHDIFGDRKVELVEGEIIELPPPGTIHGILQAELAFQLANVAKKTGNLVVVGDTGIEFFEGTLRACDAALIRTPVGSKMLDPSQILVAVEVSVSTLATDLGEKASAYARAGVAALWVIDPDASIIHVMRDPSKAGYATKSVVRFGEPLAVPGTDETIIVEQQ